MLILSRKIQENIVIGDDIQIKVLGLDGSKVLLGIKAPRDITVHRQKIYDKIKYLQIKNIELIKSRYITIT